MPNGKIRKKYEPFSSILVSSSIILTLIIPGVNHNESSQGGGGAIWPEDFLVFLLLKSKERLIWCLSCELCNVWMNSFDFIGI